MQTKKCSVTKFVAMALCALVFAFALALPMLQNDAKDVGSVSAATASVSITFSGFDKANNTVNNQVVAGIKPYAVVTFIGSNGAVDTHLITANGTVSPTSGFTATGKIEVNYPMYSTINGTKEAVGTGASFASYYSTSGTLNLTITFNDKGWFAGTTII